MAMYLVKHHKNSTSYAMTNGWEGENFEKKDRKWPRRSFRLSLQNEAGNCQSNSTLRYITIAGIFQIWVQLYSAFQLDDRISAIPAAKAWHSIQNIT